MKKPDIQISFIECPIVLNDTEQMYSPTWAYVLAANIQTMKGVECSLYDLKITDSSEINCSDIFAFSPRLHNLERVKKISNELKVKYPNSISIIGGPTVFSLNTINMLEEIDCFDYYFLGSGEETLPQFLKLFQNNMLPTEKLIKNDSPFRLKNSISMISPLLESTIHNYRIPIVETSRGCPFSCDFCDAHLLNVWDTRSPELIISEIEKLNELGKNIAFFACDNFTGNKVWAEKVCDLIIEWRKKTPTSLLFFTFASVDIAKNPTLMKKMRLAGFYNLFVGVESFAKGSLLEVSKFQNLNNDLISSLKTIQSYGFSISIGLIYGFDSDPDNIIDITLQGISKSGALLTSFCLLEALPGTRLYEKMKHENRIINSVKYKFLNQELTTNILLKKDKTTVERDLRLFQYESLKGKFRYNVFKNHLKLFSLGNFVSPQLAEDIVVSKRKRTHSMRSNRFKKTIDNISKVLKFISNIENVYYSFRAFIYTIKTSNNSKYEWRIFTYWLSSWIALYADGVSVKAPLSSDNVVSAKTK